MRPTRRHAAVRQSRVPEKVVQQQIVDALRVVGADVYVLGRPGLRKRPCPNCKALIPIDPGTRQTPGIPDLLAFLPNAPRPCAGSGPHGVRAAHQLWIECKAADGRMSDDQETFRERCQGAGQAHLVGGLDVVLQYLATWGYCEIAHYRQKGA